MRRIAMLSCALLACASGLTQQPQDFDLAARLRQLAGAAEVLEQKLPAFACRESLTSQELRGDKIKRQVQAAGDLRVMALANGKMDERFSVTEINGKPAGRRSLRVPLFVTGGFRHALGMFRPQDQACFDFRLTGQRIDVTSHVPASDACREKTDLTGSALLDAAGTLTHLEFTIPPDIAESRHAIPSGALDFSQVDLGGQTFLLSTHVVAERPIGKATYRFEATYSSCRLYQATVKIGDATAITDNPPK